MNRTRGIGDNGSVVEIRSPFPEHCLPRVWSWTSGVRNRVADDFGPKDVTEWVYRSINSQAKTWGVFRDGELGGMISFEQLSPWLGTAHCLFRKDFWGRATTRPAVEQALREMFSSGIGKLTFLVFSDNQAIRSLLSEFGAVVEGTHKHHTVQHGKPVNMKSLGLLKETFDANGSNRGGEHRGVDPRIGPVQPQEGTDQHNDPDPLPGDAGAPAAPDGVL